MKLPCGVLFVGTGVSSSVPILHHAFNSEAYNCLCSYVGKKDSPFDMTKNTRNNVSILVRIPNKNQGADSGNDRDHDDDDADEYYNVLIDLGKSFREAALSIFPKFNISRVDSIILTHVHNDAIGGFSSVLCFQQRKGSIVPIYLNAETLEIIDRRHRKMINSYAFEEDLSGSKDFKRRYELNVFDIYSGKTEKCLNSKVLAEIVGNFNRKSKLESNLKVRNIEFFINDVKVTAFPMNHGHCICMGYCFHFQDQNLVYISDYTFPLLDSSLEFLNSIKGRNKSTLILDSISYDKVSNAHANISQSLQLIEEFSPDYVYFVGMACSVEYNETNERLNHELVNLKNQGKCINTISIKLAYDGLFLPI